MIKKKKLYIVGVTISLLLLIPFFICKSYSNKISETKETISVVFDGEILGFAGAKNDTVDFFAFGSVINITDEDKKIQFLAESQKDVKTGFLKQPQLNVTDIKINEGNGKVYEDSKTISISANESLRIEIVFEGEYGGTGKGERHPPEHIQIIVIE